jgi:hypothetical protein
MLEVIRLHFLKITKSQSTLRYCAASLEVKHALFARKISRIKLSLAWTLLLIFLLSKIIQPQKIPPEQLGSTLNTYKHRLRPATSYILLKVFITPSRYSVFDTVGLFEAISSTSNSQYFCLLTRHKAMESNDQRLSCASNKKVP